MAKFAKEKKRKSKKERKKFCFKKTEIFLQSKDNVTNVRKAIISLTNGIIGKRAALGLYQRNVGFYQISYITNSSSQQIFAEASKRVIRKKIVSFRDASSET